MLNNQELVILQSLRNGKQYGYQIMKFAETLGHSISAISIFNQLGILSDKGYIIQVPSPPNEVKKYYELTDKGIEAIQ